MKNKISVCLIVKNEEKNIKECLISIKNIANEIIVLDTGSNDKTKEIASKYGQVYEYLWRDDFSEARNICISYAKSDWIMFIDADEILLEETANSIDSFLDLYNFYGPLVFNFRIINHTKEKILPEVYRNTLFKNNLGIKFTKPIGEYLHIENGMLIVKKCPQLFIIHNKLEEEETKNKSIKYISLIKTIIEKSNNIEKCSYYIELGDYHAIIDKKIESYNYYKEAYDLAESIKNNVSSSFFENILTRIVNILLISCDYQKSLIYIEKIRAINSFFYKIPSFIENNTDKLSEIINVFCLGAYAYKMFYDKEYIKAIPIYEYVIDFFNDKIDTTELQIYFYNTLTDLAQLYLITKNEKAINTLILLFSLKNNSREILIQIIKYYTEKEKIHRVIYFLNNSTNNSPDILEIIELSKKNINVDRLKNKVNALVKTGIYV
ncbi:MAG: glycosyltransferase family 2 protein [Candidatus Sericytochromatia bacterium]|nr:glycosyltransferase family 2 protein [Candidatus Sericytochromatia bacterium]